MILRIVLTVVAVRLLALPFLEIIGGALLLYIGVQLLSEEEGEDEGHTTEKASLATAIRTILIAICESLDNVIAVAAAAGGSTVLLVLGLAISIPLVVFGGALMIKLMTRYPVIVVLGAALIGWVAGESIMADHVLHDTVVANPWRTSGGGGRCDLRRAGRQGAGGPQTRPQPGGLRPAEHLGACDKVASGHESRRLMTFRVQDGHPLRPGAHQQRRRAGVRCAAAARAAGRRHGRLQSRRIASRMAIHLVLQQVGEWLKSAGDAPVPAAWRRRWKVRSKPPTVRSTGLRKPMSTVRAWAPRW